MNARIENIKYNISANATIAFTISNEDMHKLREYFKIDDEVELDITKLFKGFNK